MTVSSTTTKVSYSGNGSTTVFAYTFKVFDEDDLTVILRDNATGAETVQAINTNYSVSGVGNVNGGNITFVTAPASGVTVVVRRTSAQTQTTDYTPNDPFPAESHEEALDKLTFVQQEQQEEIDRSIKLSRTNTMTSTEFELGPTARANKVLSFDASGEISVAQELGTFKGNWSAGVSYSARDLVKDTSTNNIYLANAAHTSSGSQPLTTNTDSGKWELIVDAAAAATSATAAANSATAAANSASAASTSEGNAATSASTASTQATNAANSATSSANSATAASNAQAAAEAALDTFDDRFLGAKASDPTLDNDGNALLDGALYFDTTNDIMKVYDLANTQWRQLTLTSANQAFVNTVAGEISPTNNIATVASSINSGAFSGATSFAETYFVSATAPSSPTLGDLWFDTTNNIMKVYGSGGFVNAGSSVNGTANRYAWTVGTASGTYTGSTTVFPATYDAGYVDVFLNGVKLLVGTDVTATSGADVTLATAAAANDIVEIVAYGTFTAATALSLGDNEKIQLGASQDLQIYHNGSSSYITDQGSGNLVLGGDIAIILQNSAHNANMIDAYNGGRVGLYHAGNLKLATTATGVDVTGGLNTTGNVGIGTNSPIAQSKLTVAGNSLSITGADQNFGAGGVRGMLDLAGGYLRMGAVNGGGSASGVKLLTPTGGEALVVNSSGNVGIGTSPGNRLHVQGSGDISRFTNGTVSLFGYSDSQGLGWFTAAGASGTGVYYNNTSSIQAFYTNSTEKMRLDSLGNLRIGTTAAQVTATEKVSIVGGLGIQKTDDYPLGLVRGNSYGQIAAFFNYSGTLVGSINVAASSTSYSTSSDYRLKENVTDITDATTRLKQLNPVRFNFIADADTTVDGFLAHEVQDIVPEAISGTKDGMRDEEYEVSAATGDIYTPAVEATYDEDGVELTAAVDEVIHSADVERPEELAEGQQWRETTEAVMGTRSVPDYQGIDQSKLVPLLVKTIQELEARITALENV